MNIIELGKKLDEVFELDLWGTFETPEEATRFFGVSLELSHRLINTLIRDMHMGQTKFIGRDVVVETLNLILGGFRNKEDAVTYLEMFRNKPDNNNFAFSDSYGNTVSLSLLEESINLNWG
jgi:hypothetical protein